MHTLPTGTPVTAATGFPPILDLMVAGTAYRRRPRREVLVRRRRSGHGRGTPTGPRQIA